MWRFSLMAPPLNRFYIATGTSLYPDGNASAITKRDLRSISSVLEKLGYKNALPPLSMNPTRDGIINALERWLASDEKKDEVIFYYSGHGESIYGRHYLPLCEGRCATEDIFRAFAETPAQRTLLIFDTCYSGRVTVDIGRILDSYEDHLERRGSFITTVASSRSLQVAAESSFTPALVEALENPDGQWGGRNQAVIPIQEVIAAVEKRLPDWQRPKVHPFPSTTTGPPQFDFPNVRYVAELPEGLDLESQRNAIEHRARRLAFPT
ncbi:MAG: caspase family protein [Bryobacteraceae bacterium]